MFLDTESGCFLLHFLSRHCVIFCMKIRVIVDARYDFFIYGIRFLRLLPESEEVHIPQIGFPQ